MLAEAKIFLTSACGAFNDTGHHGQVAQIAGRILDVRIEAGNEKATTKAIRIKEKTLIFGEGL